MDGTITVNKEQVMPNFRPKGNNLAEWREKDIEDMSENEEFAKLEPTAINMDVLYEDANTIIVNKPSGISSHPSSKTDKHSVLNGLYYYLEATGETDVRLRLAHRLDLETSGAILASKNIEAHAYYSGMFERREVTKIYKAVVKNTQENLPDTIESYISRRPDREKRYSSTRKQSGRFAKTEVLDVKTVKIKGVGKALEVTVLLHTGRTHQIRVHLSEKGAPIIGDRLYRGLQYDRLLLHAYALVFLPLGEKEKVEVIANPTW
jgi:23S rRNA pseudouridine1911/1915/1917 synthase